MKREIKFRYWDSVTKHYVYSDEFNWPSPLERLDQFFAKAKNYAEDVEQYTGLKDKNGKEIYEGDILCFNFGDNTWTGPIRWEYPLGMDFNDKTRGGWVSLSNCERFSTVVGNVNQAPELIK